MNKICAKCKLPKPLDEFKSNVKYADGLFCWCKLCEKLYRHQHYIDNKEKCLDQQRERIRKNPEKYYKIRHDYNKNNRDKFKVWKSKWRAKVKDDPAFKLGHAISNNLRHALKEKKAGRHWEILLGYTVEDLIQHIDNLLTNGMTWENYGSYWHLDHVKPKSWFKYQSTNDPAFKECWALSNLQPMVALDNMKKRNYWAG